MKYEGMIPLEIQMEELSHLPDLLFINFCNEKFKINRGIYNVIDQFFFLLKALSSNKFPSLWSNMMIN
jgi:hypothetical protein